MKVSASKHLLLPELITLLLLVLLLLLLLLLVVVVPLLLLVLLQELMLPLQEEVYLCQVMHTRTSSCHTVRAQVATKPMLSTWSSSS